MKLRPQDRVWTRLALTATTDTDPPVPIAVPVSGWEATFDGAVTWLPSRDDGRGRPGWLIAGPNFPGPGDDDGGITADHVLTVSVYMYIRLRDTPETESTEPILIKLENY